MERRIGVIPNIRVDGAFGTKRYDIVLTDRRFIFVLSHSSKEHLAAGLGSVAGVAGRAVAVGIAKALTPPKYVDIVNAKPQELAGVRGNLVIDHASIRSLEMVRKWAEHRIRISYAVPGRKKPSRIEAFLDVSWKLVTEASKQGIHPKTAIREHMARIRDMILQALPPDVAGMATWRF